MGVGARRRWWRAGEEEGWRREGRGASRVCTGSSASTVTFSSSLVSTELFSLIVMLPDPISPVTENLTASFATAIVTVSPRIERSRQIFWNSPAGIFTVDLYSVSAGGGRAEGSERAGGSGGRGGGSGRGGGWRARRAHRGCRGARSQCP